MKYLIATILAITLITSTSTYFLIRKYDNFVAEQQAIGYDKGYEKALQEKEITKILKEAEKQGAVEKVKSN